MNKEFIPYEQALALKEIEFNEPCVYYVDKDNNSYIYNFQTHPDEFIEGCGVNVIPTPTFSQAFRWFRKNYKLLGSPQYFTGGYYCYTINDMKDTKESNRLFTEFGTYEEAELECLKKLIQIVKTK